ncbi:uncharacterized protein HMPREF1541_07858 [Cyphellophora europaea CBS 101466]|uniref:Histone-lysine N-methyltransferase, H3 lysine-36 specific n=1 Tax=Cyphellophora europaea (strain CBS 101466) TaxID=1220924 RepID=W2RK93_CYPE1|nr:uncharacterized protein HMPREF1541_07858 [Cyphellophora europaea CBS 101466]ETN36871.1 hypothetical protein HMPREF1541_07858 [Cyphellophora europaea CBS 101466]
MAKTKSSASTPASLDSHEANGTKREASPETGPTTASVVKKEESTSAANSPSLGPNHIKSSRSSSSSSRTRPNLSELDSKPKNESNGSAVPIRADMPKKSGRATNKAPPRVAPLFDNLPDVTSEATASFQVITSSTYQNKYLGFTEAALECDCSEEWDSSTQTNHACGEHSDCINRATKMECADDCTCGAKCQNQRFTRRRFADVSVIQTEKKGYGLRANTDLKPNEFIFEYIGEVIAENAFRKRMVAYDDEGIKHFYFMSLSRGEFIDATKRGNLGRFCNHSCNPNCYVDKWVVGDKLRMGIFAERYVKAGEELVFNYNVDRYGANPQPCYCGEDNCTGFIGGKTQTERGTKLSAATIEALGIEDDEWDTVVAKKPKKRKTAEDDEDYVESVPAKALDADGVTKVMAALMQCKEKWIAVKLLQRIQNADDDLVRHRIVRLHGYRILNSQLSAWKEDENIILQILDILDHLPRLTRNKIVDARLDQTLDTLREHSDGRVASRATALAETYASLELAYRIPRRKIEKSETSTPIKTEASVYDRREASSQRRRSRSRSKSPPRGPAALNAPTGPRSSVRPTFPIARPFPRPPPPLPRGWHAAVDGGRTYYYTDKGVTQWKRPTQPVDLPPPPPREPSHQDVLKGILANIVDTKKDDAKTPESEQPKKEKKKEEKWKSYDEEKKMKLYENTLFPHISHVMNRYKHKIPREDLKRFAKEIAKKLVASDFKGGRVKDPTKIDEKQQRKVKEYCKQFFDKAAHKHKKHEEQKAAKKTKKVEGGQETPSQSPLVKAEFADDDEDIKMSDHELDDKPTLTPEPDTPSEASQSLKRKRESPSIKDEDVDAPRSPLKKLHLDTTDEKDTAPAPPPPPPPPPATDSPMDMTPNGSTPGPDQDGDGEAEMEIDAENEEQAEKQLHAHGGESKFKEMSVADVKALAQMGDEEDEVEW